MKIFVQAKNMKVTQAIRSFVVKKTKRTISKISDQVINVKVYLENVARKKNDPKSSKAKVSIEVPGKNILAEASSFNPYQAVSKAIRTAARQLRKLKEKNQH